MAENSVILDPNEFEVFGDASMVVDQTPAADDYEVYDEVPLAVFDEKRGSTFQYPSYFTENDINFAAETEIDGGDKANYLGMQKVDNGIFSNAVKGIQAFAVSIPGNILSAFKAEEQGFAAKIEKGEIPPLEPFFVYAMVGAMFTMNKQKAKGGVLDPEDIVTVSKISDEFNVKTKEFLRSKDLIPPPSGAGKVAFDVSSGAGSVVYSLGLLMLTKKPQLVGAVFGAAQKGATFDELIEAGVPAEEANERSTLQGAWEAAVELIGGGAFLDAAKLSRPLNRTAFRFAQQGIEEGFQQAGEEIGLQDIRRTTGVEILKRTAYATALGVIVSAPLSTISTVAEQAGFEKALVKVGFSKKQAKQLIKEQIKSNMNSEEFIKSAEQMLLDELRPLAEAAEQAKGTMKAELEKIIENLPDVDEEAAEEETKRRETAVDRLRKKGVSQKVAPRLTVGQRVLPKAIQAKIAELQEKGQNVEAGQLEREGLNDILSKINEIVEGKGSQAEKVVAINKLVPAVAAATMADVNTFVQEITHARREVDQGIKDNKVKFIRKKETSFIKQRVKDILRGRKEGAVDARKETQMVQRALRDILRRANLTPAQRDKFDGFVRKTKTVEQLNTNINSFLNRISKVEDQSSKKEATNLVKKLAQKFRPRKQAGKPIGNLTPEVQDVLDGANKASKLTSEDARIALDKRLAEQQERVDAGGAISAIEQFQNQLLEVFSQSPALSLDDILDVAEILQNLISFGRLGGIARQTARQEHKERVVNDAVETVSGGKDILPTKDGIFKRLRASLQRTAIKSLQGWDDLMDMLSFYDKSSTAENSKLSKRMNVKIIESQEKGLNRVLAERLMKTFLDAFGLNSKQHRQLFKTLKDANAQVDLGIFIDRNGNRQRLLFSRAQAWDLLMKLKDPDLRESITGEEQEALNDENLAAAEKLAEETGEELNFTPEVIKGNAFTDEMLSAVTNMASTQEDSAVVEGMLNFYSELYPQINEVYKRIYGVNLPKNDFYSPLFRIRAEQDVYEGFLAGINFRRGISGSNSLKSRVPNLLPIKFHSSTDVVQRHMIEMAHFITWAEKLQDINAVFSNTKFREIVAERFPTGLLKGSILKLIDKQIVHFTTNRIDRADGMGTYVEFLRRQLPAAVLPLKMAITLKQLVSTAAYWEFLPAHVFMAEVIAFPINIDQKIAVLNESEFVKARGRGNITRDIRDSFRSQEFAAFRQNPNFKNWLLFNVRFGDIAAIYMGGWAVYQHTLNETGSKTKAMAAFERASSKTQQSGDLSELSDMQRGGPLGKALTMFTTSQIQYMRRELSAIRNLQAGRLSKKEFAKKMVIYHFLLPQMFQMVVNFGQFDPEEQLRALVLGSLNGIVIWNDILDMLIRLGINIAAEDEVLDVFPGFDFPIFSFVEDLKRGILGIEDAIDAEDYISATKDIMSATAGAHLGIPVEQLFNFYEAAQDISDGDIDAGLLKLGGWSPYHVNKVLEGE